MPVLVVNHLEVTRGLANQAFKVSLPSLELSAGQAIAVTGSSGCGKSTLIEALGLILEPSRLDRFELVGQDMTQTVKARHHAHDRQLSNLRGQHYGFVPQTNGLLHYLSVQQNIELQAKILGRPVQADWLAHATSRLGLASLTHRFVRELSIGQRQRVSFLRAIAHRPDILLADEPTAALDPDHATELFELMLALANDLQVATIVVTHEWDLVKSFGLNRLVAQSVGPSHMAFVPCQA
jgi:putative ABC transport system ATP-binding protein